MNEHWHETPGPDQSDPSTHQPAPSQGPAIPLPAAGAGPVPAAPDPEAVASFPPTGPLPAAGPPTPPSGLWGAPPPPPPSGWTPGAPVGPPAGGAWGSGTVPPGPGWAAPGFVYPPPPAHPTGSKSRTGVVVGLASVVVAAAVLAGAGLGHAVWPSTAAAPSASSPSTGGTGGSGGGFSPFGGGSSSGGSSTGNSSTGAGAPSNITAIATKVSPALVDINTNLSYQNEQAAGTGMVLTANGVILTNNHVIDGATSISVTDVGNSKTYDANVVGYDRTGDIAVIKLVGASGLQTVTTSSGTASVGQAVVGVGNAGGTGGTPSSAGGSITAVDQSITASDQSGGNSEDLTGLIQTNAGIQPGDSGGPLVNPAGQVVGMDTAASSSSQYQVSASQAYAIPVATALSVAKQIEAGKGSSTLHIGATGFLGVSVESASAASPGGFGGGSLGGGGSATTTPGATVQSTLSSSAAAQAGVAAGDVITALNGATISTAADLSNALESHHPGDTVQLTWTDTSGQTHTAGVKLATGPPA